MVDAGFFRRLETLVHAMHRRHIVHLDIRNRRNVLVSEKGGPGLLDFQSSLNLDHVPRRLHRFLKEIDISGVYKLWELNDPASMDAERKARLAAVNRKRGLWVFKGYPLGTRKAPRQ
jgi:RIO-like serine/threonine protein kinase